MCCSFEIKEFEKKIQIIISSDQNLQSTENKITLYLDSRIIIILYNLKLIITFNLNNSTVISVCTNLHLTLWILFMFIK